MKDSADKIHVYLMPGMAASPSIFEYINLSPSEFQLHLLEWFIPSKNTSLQEYAKVMTQSIKHQDPVLVGVSFGGMLVQEMAKIISVKKTIIISSVKTDKELPNKMLFARFTGAHKVLPTSLVNNVEVFAKYAFGETLNKRLALYEKYLGVRDPVYLDWAIHQMVNWKQADCAENLIHIHGEKDPVFPINRIKNCIPVKNGTHAMIIHRAKWFNEHLPTIILQ